MGLQIWLLLVGVTFLPRVAYSHADQAPTIIVPPLSQTYLLGDIANISCLATGTPAPTYQWFFNDIKIEGESLPYLIIYLFPEHRGVYHCVATNRAGSGESNRVQITIEDIRQYTMTLEVLTEPNDVVILFANNLVGLPAGDNGVTILATELKVGSILVTLIAYNGDFPGEGLTDSLQAAANEEAQSFGIIITGVQRFDGCPSEEIDNFIWPEVDLYLLGPIHVSCNCGSLDISMLNLQAVRNCRGSYTEGAKWMDPGDSTACRFSAAATKLCALYDVMPEHAVHYYHNNLTESDLDPNTVALATAILYQTPIQAAIEETIAVLNLISDLQSLSPSMLQHSQDLFSADRSMTDLLTSTIDAISTNLPLEGDSVPMTVMSDDHGVAVTAVRLNVSSFQGVSFDINATDDGFMNGINTYTFASNVTSISLPDTLFVELGTNVLNDSFISTFTVFESDNLFVSSGEVMPVIASSVISAEIPGLNVFDLENPITLAFQMYQELDNDSTAPVCVYYDINTQTWSPSGCEVAGAANGMVYCRCNHLTSFAVRMDASPSVTEQHTDNEEVHNTFVLEIITYICLAVSIGGLLLTIITHLITTKLRTSDVGQMLLNLCFALLGLYVAFLISTSAGSLTTEAGKNACGFFSALLHYFMLAYFFWTAAEALFLFFKLVKVLRGNMNTYVYVSMAICWSFPVVIVAISLGGYQHYTSDTFCRPIQWPFWFGFVAPFALIYAFNWVIFVVIMVALCMHSRRSAVLKAKDTNVKSVIGKHLLIAVVLSLLFGLGWAFGLIGTSSLPEEAYTPAQYIFSIFTGTQGVLIFLLHAVRSREARQEWKKWWYTVTCRRNSYKLKRCASVPSQVTIPGSSITSIPYIYREGDGVFPLSSCRDGKEILASAATSTIVENVCD